VSARCRPGSSKRALCRVGQRRRRVRPIPVSRARSRGEGHPRWRLEIPLQPRRHCKAIPPPRAMIALSPGSTPYHYPQVGRFWQISGLRTPPGARSRDADNLRSSSCGIQVGRQAKMWVMVWARRWPRGHGVYFAGAQRDEKASKAHCRTRCFLGTVPRSATSLQRRRISCLACARARADWYTSCM
jgi:hypothetical protein